MEVKSRKILFYLSFLWLVIGLALAGWWLFLIVQMSHELEALAPEVINAKRYFRIAKWEGSTFILLQFLISGTLFYFYYQDLKKQQSLSSFFSSLTHDLKTPLASIRLQTEILNEGTKHNDHPPHFKQLGARLIEDAQRLEDELDKLLQLSRIERNGDLHLAPIPVNDFFQIVKRRIPKNFELDIKGSKDTNLMIDEFAFGLVFRNLIDNTIKHGERNAATVTLSEQGEHLIMDYYDDGVDFKGELSELGKLFYKQDSSKGSGIGLYLCKELVEKMNGSFIASEQNNKLRFTLKVERTLS